MSSASERAFARRAWGVVYRLLSELPRHELTDVDLERLAVAAYLIGQDDAAVAAWEHAYRRRAGAGDCPEAARYAFWAAFALMMRGQMAAGGWLSRAGSLLGDDLVCPARGYLLIPALLGALDSDDAAGALQHALQIGEIAARFRDPDLGVLAMLGHGQALLALGDEAAGLAALLL